MTVRIGPIYGSQQIPGYLTIAWRNDVRIVAFQKTITGNESRLDHGQFKLDQWIIRMTGSRSSPQQCACQFLPDATGHQDQRWTIADGPSFAQLLEFQPCHIVNHESAAR